MATAAARSLERLPDELLRAMVRGLHSNADDLAPGALFRRPDGGGCAVGVTLRELAPDAFRFGRLEFWLWHRWRRGLEPDVARRFPQLRQLQRLFDTAVAQLEEAGRHSRPATTVGMWLAASAGAELRARQTRAYESRRFANPSARFSRRRTHQPRPAHLTASIGEHHRARLEVSSCS